MKSTKEKKSFIHFKDRTDYNWSDIEPLPQYEGDFPVLKTKYPPNYEEIMGYFRRVTQNNEISMRVYDLTSEVIKLMCGSYTAWHIRRKCVEKLKIDLNKEYLFVLDMIPDNEKNYQIWEYKRYLCNNLKNPEREIKFLDTIFSKENKNYHAWSFRIWLCQEFNLYEQELKKIDWYLCDDVGNNSAWNYRYFLIHKSIDSNQKLEEELIYIFEKIKLKPNNEASWNYLNGWFQLYCFQALDPNPDLHMKHIKKFIILDFPVVEEFCKKILEESKDIRFAYTTLININLFKNTIDSLTQAIQYIEGLINNFDKIRNVYWLWFKQQTKELLDNMINNKHQKSFMNYVKNQNY